MIRFFTHFVYLVLLLVPCSLQAQMFTVEETHRPARQSVNVLYAGFDYLNMDYRGNSSEADHPIFSISESVYRLGLDLSGISAHLSFGRSLGDPSENADSLNYLDVSLSFTNTIPIYMNRRGGIGLPTKLSTNYTRVTSDNTNLGERNEFRMSSIIIGIGIQSHVHLSKRIRFHVSAVPQIGFSISALGTDSGSIARINSDALLLFNNLIGRYGVSAGYEFDYKRYSGDRQFNYAFKSHVFKIGISF